MKLTTWLSAAALVVSIGACKKDDKKDETKATGKTTTKEEPKGSGSASAGSGSASAGSGSATASGSGSGSAPAPAGDAWTPEKMAARYQECWGFFSDGKFDDFKGCFAPDAVSHQIDSGQPDIKGNDAIAADAKQFKDAFPDAKGEVQLTLVGDNHIVGIVLVTGTNDGAMGGMPATHKKVAMLIGHEIDMDPKTGLATEENAFIDSGVMMGQLGVPGAPQAPLAAAIPEKGAMAATKGDDTEKKNLDTAHAALDAFNKHDIAAFKATRADGAQWYESMMGANVPAEQMLKGLEGMWKSFSDLKLEVGGEFAAGDYVVSFGQMTGTNDGPIEMMKVKDPTKKPIKLTYLNISHYKDGKVDQGYLFENSLAMAMQLGLIPQPGGK